MSNDKPKSEKEHWDEIINQRIDNVNLSLNSMTPQPEKCGCKIVNREPHHGLNVKHELQIEFCLLHANAGKLLTGLQNAVLMLTAIANEKGEDPLKWTNYKRLLAILAAAEVKP